MNSEKQREGPIRNTFIDGLNSQDIRQRLSEKDELTFKTAYEHRQTHSFEKL